VRTINQRDLRNDSSAILRAVEAGESMVIAKSGIPVAELRPLRRARSVKAEAWRAILQHLPPIDAQALRHDVDEALDPAPRDPFETAEPSVRG
jgi:antitoxin (DNA-binding transcriptional repressor) of toxin-antitoxin stability system